MINLQRAVHSLLNVSVIDILLHELLPLLAAEGPKPTVFSYNSDDQSDPADFSPSVIDDFFLVGEQTSTQSTQSALFISLLLISSTSILVVSTENHEVLP